MKDSIIEFFLISISQLKTINNINCLNSIIPELIPFINLVLTERYNPDLNTYFNCMIIISEICFNFPYICKGKFNNLLLGELYSKLIVNMEIAPEVENAVDMIRKSNVIENMS